MVRDEYGGCDDGGLGAQAVFSLTSEPLLNFILARLLASLANH